MPPKKKDEPVEKQPEGDDERLLTISFKGTLSNKPTTANGERGLDSTVTTNGSPPFQSLLNNPYFSLMVPTENSSELVRPNIDLGKEPNFDVTVLNKKITIAAPTIQNLLGSSYKATIWSCSESKQPDQPTKKVAASGKKGGGAGKSGTGDGNVTARSDDSMSGDSEIHSFKFELSNVLTKDTWELQLCTEDDGGTVQGFDSLTMVIACSQPLLCHANLLKYQPVTVEVVKAECLPPTTTLGLIQNQDGKQTQSMMETTSLHRNYTGVSVRYNFFGTEVVTAKHNHMSHIDFKEKRTFFLHDIPPLELATKLFAEPLRFELHDRDTLEGQCNFYGVGSMTLRTALDGVQKFTQPMQVVPHTEEHLDAPVTRGSEYLALGTMLEVKIRFLLPVSPIEYVAAPSGSSPSHSTVESPTAPIVPHLPSSAPTPGGIESASSVGATKVPSDNEKGLSRLLIRLPYSGPKVRPLLQAIMGTMIKYGKVSEEGDIRVLERRSKSPPPPLVEEKPKGKEAKGKEKVVEVPKPIEKEELPLVPLPLQLYISESVSGFEIMDEEQRIIVIEGPRGALNKMAEVTTAVAGEDPAVHIIFNTSFVVPRRIYSKYPPLVLPLPLPKKEEPKEVIVIEDDKGAGKTGRKPNKARATPDKLTREKVPEVPPIEPTPTEPVVAKTPVFALNRDELDSGGVGGRIRRIRLSELLPVLQKRQKNFIHRTFTRECLRAVVKLNLLKTAQSMIEAVDHDYFPTPGEVIALERVTGMTLETMDVCGADKFYAFSNMNVDNLVADVVRDHRLQKELAARPKAPEVDFSDLRSSVGKVVSFVAIPATIDQLKGLPNLSKKLQHFQYKAYMHHLESDVCVLCAFNVQPPTQLLRFEVTAQIVDSTNDAGEKSEPALYVMSLVSLAKRGTDSRNPDFDAVLARNARKAPPQETKRIRREANDRYHRTHKLRGSPSQGDTDSEDEDLNELPILDKDDDNDFKGAEVAVEDYQALNKVRLQKGSKKNNTVRGATSGPDYSFALNKLDELQRKDDRNNSTSQLTRIKANGDFRTAPQKTAADDRKHPMAPSGSRVEDLGQSWVPPSTKNSIGAKDGGHRMTVAGAKDILGNPFKMKSIFQSDSAKEAAKQEADDRQRELDEWKSKVVVDNANFRVVGNKNKDFSNIIDKQKGMLVDAPVKYSIKKGWTKPPPVSIREVEREERTQRVDATVSKHPTTRQFYYAKQLQGKIPKVEPVPDHEKKGPLYYDRPSFKGAPQ